MTSGVRLFRHSQVVAGPPAAPQHIAKNGDPRLLKAIAAAHLFGSPTLPATTVDYHDGALTLTGTIALANPQEGAAIIAAAGGPSTFYVRGGQLPGGGTLDRVYSDYIVLLHDGTEEVLRLVRHGVPGSAVAESSAKAGTPPDQFANTIFLDDAKLKEPGFRLNPMPSAATAALRPQGMVVDKHLMGYAVAPVDGLALPGLKAGEIVTAINGVPLEDGTVAGKMFDALASGQPATVTVRTGEGLVDRNVDFSGLAANLATPKKKPRG
jgi:general secretion pathway protein C